MFNIRDIVLTKEKLGEKQISYRLDLYVTFRKSAIVLWLDTSMSSKLVVSNILEFVSKLIYEMD